MHFTLFLSAPDFANIGTFYSKPNANKEAQAMFTIKNPPSNNQQTEANKQFKNLYRSKSTFQLNLLQQIQSSNIQSKKRCLECRTDSVILRAVVYGFWPFHTVFGISCSWRSLSHGQGHPQSAEFHIPFKDSLILLISLPI